MSGDKRMKINGLVNNDKEPAQPPPAQSESHWRFHENGRDYYAYDYKVEYPFPIDNFEAESLEMFHETVYNNALGGQLYKADMIQCARGNGRQQVLDIGCGNGLWCFEMAERHPEMDVVGIDLYVNRPADQPMDIPKANCTLHAKIDFRDHHWGPFSHNSFDLIHAARLCGSVANWDHLASCIFRHLKPGGLVEHVEIDWDPKPMRDPAFPQKDPEFPTAANPLRKWYYSIEEASKLSGKPITYRRDMEAILTRTGFDNINHHAIRIPLQRFEAFGLTNTWEKHLVESFIMSLTGWRENLYENTLAGMSLSLCTRYLGMERRAVGQLCLDVVNVLSENGMRKDIPVYYEIHIWTARKPMG